MEIIKLQEYCSKNGVTGISKVRTTKDNGYPFLTFLSPKFTEGDEKGARNIWFSKASSKKVTLGQEPKALGLGDYYVVHTTNAEGQPRIKLTNNSEYSSVKELF